MILDSLRPEMIPDTDSATLILEEESATLQAADGRRMTFPAISGTVPQVSRGRRPPRSDLSDRVQRASDGLLGGDRAVRQRPPRTGEKWLEVRAPRRDAGVECRGKTGVADDAGSGVQSDGRKRGRPAR